MPISKDNREALVPVESIISILYLRWNKVEIPNRNRTGLRIDLGT